MILVASSAGSTFGVAVARRRPDLLHAYVGTDQNVSPQAAELTYRLTLGWLRESGNAKGVRVVEAIGPDHENWTMKQADTVVRWAIKAHPTAPDMISDVIRPAMMSSPEHTLRDLRDLVKGMTESMDQFYDQLSAFDARSLGTDFAVPFFVFHGDSDPVTPTAAAKDYFDAVIGPHKEFALIENSGHLALYTRPDQFLDELLHRVRPIATGPLPAKAP